MQRVLAGTQLIDGRQIVHGSFSYQDALREQAARDALTELASAPLQVIDTDECAACERWFYGDGLQCEEHGEEAQLRRLREQAVRDRNAVVCKNSIQHG